MAAPLPLCTDRVIGVGTIGALPAAMARHQFGRRLMLVCDDTTYVAAGQQIYVSLLPTHEIKPYSLGRHVVAKVQAAEKLASEARGYDALLAVGTGTVNDTVKYAAHRLNIPYICIPTGASMNGFTSATASLEAEGIKLSLAAAPPCAVVADMVVIAASPKKLSRAGLGDTLCRTTVEADCILSHHITGSPYPREEFDLMRRHEEELIGQIGKIKESDQAYLCLLMDALLDAGDAMARAGSSITASQGEHMIAHTAEMIYGSEIRALHGEMISVTSRTMNDLQNKMLLAQPVVRSLPRDEAYFARIFGKKMAPLVSGKYASKVFSEAQAAEINEKITRDWPEIKQQLSHAIIQTTVLDRAFIHGNIPQAPKDVGLNADRYNAAVTYAYLTRNRFTFLDLAQMMGRRA